MEEWQRPTMFANMDRRMIFATDKSLIKLTSNANQVADLNAKQGQKTFQETNTASYRPQVMQLRLSVSTFPHSTGWSTKTKISMMRKDAKSSESIWRH